MQTISHVFHAFDCLHAFLLILLRFSKSKIYKMVPATKKLQLTLLSGKRKRLFISLLLLIYLIYPKIKANATVLVVSRRCTARISHDLSGHDVYVAVCAAHFIIAVICSAHVNNIDIHDITGFSCQIFQLDRTIIESLILKVG